MVTHGVGPFFHVTNYQVRINLFHIFGNEPKAEGTRGFNLRLVTKADRLEPIDYLTCYFHRLDVVLEMQNSKRKAARLLNAPGGLMHDD